MPRVMTNFFVADIILVGWGLCEIDAYNMAPWVGHATTACTRSFIPSLALIVLTSCTALPRPASTRAAVPATVPGVVPDAVPGAVTGEVYCVDGLLSLATSFIPEMYGMSPRCGQPEIIQFLRCKYFEENKYSFTFSTVFQQRSPMLIRWHLSNNFPCRWQ